MRVVNAKRRGQPLKPWSIKTPRWSSELVHLISHLSFDGRVDRYGCSYYSRNYGQARHVERLLRRLLGVRPRRRRRDNGIWVVSYYNVKMAAWLQRREQQLLRVVRAHDAWSREWLRAFFDDEGHIHFSKQVRRVRASQYDSGVLRQAKASLKSLGIRSRLDIAARAVEIRGERDLQKFRRQINFSPGICINAHRKNGLWDYPFEKRVLLDKALASYQ